MITDYLFTPGNQSKAEEDLEDLRSLGAHAGNILQWRWMT